jgi:hypothetical protein
MEKRKEWVSMGTLGEHQEKKKVKHNLRYPRGAYQDPIKAGKSDLMRSSKGPIGALTGPLRVFIWAPLGALSPAPLGPPKVPHLAPWVPLGGPYEA